ncbi:MAG: trimeric intracellular cation channel family protein, partial [Stomatobaculum longum]
LGTVTGVGGGAIRDIFANQMPEIFWKNIYAMASVPGAILTVLAWRMLGSENKAALIGSLCVILVRCIAVRYDWNLPRVPKRSGQA